MTAPRLVLVGDSITAYWARFRPGFLARHGFVHRGVGGETTRQVRARFGRDVRAAGAPAVHLMAGLNDIAENEGPVDPAETRAHLAAMMDEAGSLGLTLLVGSVTPAAHLAWNPRVRPAAAIQTLNLWLREATAARGAIFLDYHAVLSDAEGGMRPGLGPDGSHLDAAGYRLIEPVLLAALPGLPPLSWAARLRARFRGG